MSSRRNFLKFFVLFTIFDAEAQDEICFTPDLKIGFCIPALSCESFMDLLDIIQQPIPSDVKNYLKEYSCGFNRNQPKMCCPSEPINIPGITTPNQTIPPPPDVSKHRNINLLPKNCGVLDTSEKIVFGNKTNLLEFPWMVLLSYKTSRGPDFKCGGTIINDKYILTAAHCITELRFPLLGVRIGEHDIRTRIDCEDTYCAPPYQDLAIEKIIPHPQFSTKSLTYDIGLLKVAPMNLSLDNIKPVCLPVDKARFYDFTNKTKVVVAGWGITETGQTSPELLKAELPIASSEQCRNIYGDMKITINYRQLCAGGSTESDSCGGDSGGPLHVVDVLYDDQRLVQRGIVSFGPRKCGRNNGIPGVYTRVAYYMDWILDNIEP